MEPFFLYNPSFNYSSEKGYQVCLISHKSQQWIIGSNCVVPMRQEFKQGASLQNSQMLHRNKEKSIELSTSNSLIIGKNSPDGTSRT